MKTPFLVMQAERRLLAQHFVDKFSFAIEMVVDPLPDNPFDTEFAPWPLRFYILHQDRVVFIAQPRNCTYDVSALRDALLGLL